MGEGELLGDRAAHRDPDDVGALDLERVEQAERVAGHVGDREGQLGPARAAHAAVVEDDAVEARLERRRGRAAPRPGGWRSSPGSAASARRCRRARSRARSLRRRRSASANPNLEGERFGCPPPQLCDEHPEPVQADSLWEAAGASWLPSCLRLRYSVCSTSSSRDAPVGGGSSSASEALTENGAKFNGALTPSLARQRGQESSVATRIGLNRLPHLWHLNISILPALRSAHCGPAVRNTQEILSPILAL